MSSKQRPRAIARLIELGVPFASENGALHLTREGGHSHRRIVHVADATGWAIQQALEDGGGEASEHHARAGHGRDRPGHRPPRDAFLDQRRGPRPLRLQPQEEAGRDADRPGDDPRHRRRGPRLSLFDRAARRDRRRHRHGVARGLPRLQHGIHAVPPDLPLQSRGQEFPDHRGGARRRRACSSYPDAPAQRFMPDYDERAELAPRDIVARAIDHEIKRARPRLRPPRHLAPRAGLRARALPEHLREAARPRHRHHQASRSRSCRRSITPAAAWSWTSTAAPTRRASMPPAK